MRPSRMAAVTCQSARTATGRIAGVEALVRWRHPLRGPLPPSAFLSVADDSGLVVDLGDQVLAEAASQVAAWRTLPGCAGLALSVNVSAQELQRPERAGRTAELLSRSGLPAAALTVEVLETVLLDAEGAVEASLQAYGRLGVRLALDDFGTGATSLLHLQGVPFDTVKVDQRFVEGLGASRRASSSWPRSESIVPPLTPPRVALTTSVTSVSSPSPRSRAASASSSTPRSDGIESKPQVWTMRAPLACAARAASSTAPTSMSLPASTPVS